MADLLLIHGAASGPGLWHLVQPLLEARGHRVVAVTLPAAAPTASVDDYADAAVAQWRAATRAEDAEPERRLVVAQSLGAFTAPVVAERIDAWGAVLVNAMIPLPGETPGHWFDTTGSGEAAAAFAAEQGRAAPGDAFDDTDFTHDVDPAVLAASVPDGPIDQADGVMSTPARFTAWPEHVHVVAGRDDRFFPATFQQRQAVERLGVVPELVPGGHLAPLSFPREVADAIAGFAER